MPSMLMFAGNLGDAQDFPALLDAAEATRARGPALADRR